MRTTLYAGSDFAAPHDAGNLSRMLAAALHRFDDWRRARRDIRNLSSYSDAMLKDMGIARSEIASVVRHGRSETAHHKH